MTPATLPPLALVGRFKGRDNDRISGLGPKQIDWLMQHNPAFALHYPTAKAVLADAQRYRGGDYAPRKTHHE